MQDEAFGFLRSAIAGMEDAQAKSAALPAADLLETSLMQTFLAREAAANPAKQVLAADGGYEAKFDEQDILGWAGSLFSWVKKLKKHPFVELAHGEGVEQMPSAGRVALLSDWGTGLYGAPVCAESIRRDSAGMEDLIHLGDVYYSGDEDEVRDRFTAFWPAVAGARNRALNANHEMYTGGKAYFRDILGAFGQRASYFALQNDHWLIVGLDTGYDEHDLHGNQAQWLTALVNGAGSRKVVLLSHHQPYSLYEKQGSKLVAQLRPLLEAKRIFAWYWGHEHRCVIHEPHGPWGLLGRCIGHSGFPYFRDFKDAAPAAPTFRRKEGANGVPAADVLDGRNKYVEEAPERYGPNGYVELVLDGPKLAEHYRDADGALLRSNQLA